MRATLFVIVRMLSLVRIFANFYRKGVAPRSCMIAMIKYSDIISESRSFRIQVWNSLKSGQVTMMKVFRNNEDAFTGLEAAIVLIAFVVVAAVFSYVVLGAGFFTTQKSQETVHSGVAMASSAVEILGDVYGTATTPASGVDKIKFTLGLAAGATSVDMNKAVMIYSDSTQVDTLNHDQSGGPLAAGNWNVTERLHTLGSENLMLEAGEQFVIEAMPPTAMPAYTAFNLEVKPPVGASLAIKRTVPANVNAVNLLY